MTDMTKIDGAHAMSKNRLEAFSDGVFAIIITIMVLELKLTLRSGRFFKQSI
jgi:uncharacterized membrane protein